jgi:hypothetical protein
MREVALMLGSEVSIFNFPQWLPIQRNQSSTELWVDFWNYEVRPDTRIIAYTIQKLEQYIKDQSIQRLVFYDLFHYHPAFSFPHIEMIKYFQTRLPTSLVTICKRPIPELENVVHFDFYWNRTKHAYHNKSPTWKQSDAGNYNQWPIMLDHRPLAVLSLYGENNQGIKKPLYNAIHHIPGHHSTAQNVLPSDSGDTELGKLVATPPARRFFDSTYISAQVESLVKGPNVIFCEKTYDHLIQGRFVLNFGPRHYYRTLAKNGWRLPVLPAEMDFWWDDIEDQTSTDEISNEPRFLAYVDFLKRLTTDQNMLHELFISNIDVFEHNHQQLQQRPYDIFNLEQLDHK